MKSPFAVQLILTQRISATQTSLQQGRLKYAFGRKRVFYN